MADHTLSVHFIVKPDIGTTGKDADVSRETAPPEHADVEWTHHFDGYDVSHWGGVRVTRVAFKASDPGEVR